MQNDMQIESQKSSYNSLSTMSCLLFEINAYWEPKELSYHVLFEIQIYQ